MLSLKEKIIVISGGATGLGKEYVDTLQSLEGIEAIVVLDLPKYIPLNYTNNNTHYISIDLSDYNSIEEAFNIISGKFDRIDILINNAGVNQLISTLNITENIWDDIINVNLKGTFFVCKFAFPLLVKGSNASIINMASQFSVVGGPFRTPYAASKAGIVSLTKTLALEWADHNIRVNAISPTICIKDSTINLLELPNIKEKLLSKIPLKRFCTSKDIIGAIIFLACDSSSMITGHNLLIDGGWTVQ